MQRYNNRNAFSRYIFCYFSKNKKIEKLYGFGCKRQDFGRKQTNLTNNRFLKVVVKRNGKIGIFFEEIRGEVPPQAPE